MDNASEAVIRQALEKIAGLFTMIVHRRSSIRHSDRVVVMSAGRIGEQCHPDELIRRRGFCELSWLESVPSTKIVAGSDIQKLKDNQ